MHSAETLPSSHFNATERIIAIGLFILLWTFLFIRAIYVPVLHDEIATFFYYIQSDNYMPPAAHWDANNHVFNSMVSNVSYHLFGSSPLSLRLPNVLSYALLFFGAFKIAGRLKTIYLRWGLLLAITCSHYLFEYMGECRGYGMSMSFFVIALHYFFQIREKENLKYYILIAIFLFIATAANLTLIIPSVLIFGALFLHLFLENKNNLKVLIQRSIGLLGLAIPFILLVKLSFTLKDKGALYYGGDSGFYDITVSSVTKVFSNFYNLPIAILLTVIFFGVICHILLQVKKNKRLSVIFEQDSFFGLLFVSSVICILILSNGLKVNYPEDRAAMHLFILFVTAYAFSLDKLSFKPIGILLFYFPLLFITQITHTSSIFSTEERTSHVIYEYIENTPQNFKFPNLVGGYKTQEFCWYYLNNRSGGNQGKIHTHHHIALDADFQIVRDGRIEDSTRLFNYYSPVLSDPTTTLTLFERKEKLPKELIFSETAKPTNGYTTDEYHNILEIEIDSLRNKTLYIGAEMTLDAKQKPFISWLAVTLNDSLGNSLYQEYIPLDWIRKNWDGQSNNLLQGTLLHNVPEEAKILKFYIWNIDKTSYSIPNGKCYLYKLERDFPNQY